jgi:ribosomal protein S27AE
MSDDLRILLVKGQSPNRLPFTDEISTEFYACPRCDFQRIPHFIPHPLQDAPEDEASITAKFCPGCGGAVIWHA